MPKLPSSKKMTEPEKPETVEQAGEENETPDPVEPETDEPKDPKVSAYDVLRGEIYVRQYSFKVHGPNFEALAREFASKSPARGHSYTLVPAHSIGKVEVRYREKEDADLHIDKQKPDSPMVDKVRVFDDKNAAVAFATQKFGSSVVVSRKK